MEYITYVLIGVVAGIVSAFIATRKPMKKIKETRCQLEELKKEMNVELSVLGELAYKTQHDFNMHMRKNH